MRLFPKEILKIPSFHAIFDSYLPCVEKVNCIAISQAKFLRLDLKPYSLKKLIVSNSVVPVIFLDRFIIIFRGSSNC